MLEIESLKEKETRINVIYTKDGINKAISISKQNLKEYFHDEGFSTTIVDTERGGEHYQQEIEIDFEDVQGADLDWLCGSYINDLNK